MSNDHHEAQIDLIKEILNGINSDSNYLEVRYALEQVQEIVFGELSIDTEKQEESGNGN